jgi:hypothetical protein
MTILPPCLFASSYLSIPDKHDTAQRLDKLKLAKTITSLTTVCSLQMFLKDVYSRSVHIYHRTLGASFFTVNAVLIIHMKYFFHSANFKSAVKVITVSAIQTFIYCNVLIEFDQDTHFIIEGELHKVFYCMKYYCTAELPYMVAAIWVTARMLLSVPSGSGSSKYQRPVLICPDLPVPCTALSDTAARYCNRYCIVIPSITQ